jgi:hypothetical protein
LDAAGQENLFFSPHLHPWLRQPDKNPAVNLKVIESQLA